MSPETWETFFLGQLGATAALAGLLFVAVSINVARIIEVGGLAERGFDVLLTLLAILTVSALMLLPEQSLAAMGLEILAVAALTIVTGLLVGRRGLRQTATAYRRHFVSAMGAFVGVFGISVVGGILLILGNPSGLYWLAIGMCLGVVKAVIDAWVLLVEINR